MYRLWSQHRFGIFLIFWLWSLTLFAAPKPTDVVAEIDTVHITVEDVQRKLFDLSSKHPEKRLDRLRQVALDELVNDHLLNLKARTILVEEDSSFLQQADHLLSQIIGRELYKRAVLSTIAVGDSETVERYRQKPEAYRYQEWTHAQHILIAPVQDTILLTPLQKQTGWWADTDQEAKEIADSLYRLIRTGASFDSLAKRWSQDMASGVNGGDLGIFIRGQMVPEFDSAAFNQPVGAISPPLKTRFGYHIIRVKERQNADVAPFSDSLKEVIRQQIEAEKMVARSRVFLDSLRGAVQPAYNSKVFKMSDSALQVQTIWAATTAYGDTVWSQQLGAQLAALRRPSQNGDFSREQKTEILTDLLFPLIMRRAAGQMGIDTSAAVQAQKEKIYQNERVMRLRKQAVLDYTPAEEEIKKYYDEHKSEWIRSESLSVHVHQMLFKNRKGAEQIYRELAAGADFALLAKKYFPGDSDIAREAFDLGFISPPAMPKAFFSVAETLTIGTVSQPFRTRWGYHLIRVVARRPDLSLDAARRRIIAALRKEKQEEHQKKWETSLREGHVISIKERVLKSIKYDPASGGISGKP